ncbi:hypothetical protein B0T22DRAFT_176585 [Podospora appendiculata]|uniref:Uncharacterized protein n=1 Tax=Podospora appendiculata TaxID=314037 RepID=A0AAE0XC04_9PEZI|nr:hypothetical protein B0T22DRAFT_176585 [Podospora appendiculata]
MRWVGSKRRSRKHGLGFLPVAYFILVPLCVMAGSAPPGSFRELHLRPRRNGEHVILADCVDPSRVVSSQMAYFIGVPGPSPQDVAVVSTEPGQAALWVNTNTSGLFTDTAAVFTSVLGPKVPEGGFAGRGYNNWTDFSCWQKYVTQLYTYDKTVCSQVYDCNHDPAPTTTSTATNTSTASSAQQSTDSGLSHGVLVAIIVGVVGSIALIAAGLAFLWYWRRLPTTHQAIGNTSGRGCCGVLRRKRAERPWPPEEHVRFEAAAQADPTKSPNVTGGVYELDGQFYRVEMGNDHGKVEMDGRGVREADGKGAHPHSAFRQQTEVRECADTYQAESRVLHADSPAPVGHQHGHSPNG